MVLLRASTFAAAIACAASPAAAFTPGKIFGPMSGDGQIHYTPKDFTIIKSGDWWHAVYIMTNLTVVGGQENKFGHSISRNLIDWTFVDTIYTTASDPTAFDARHVWAPTIVQSNGAFLMFYTGVNNADVQSIGVATTPELSTTAGGTTWSRSHDPIDQCGQASWQDCGDHAFRDPFIMPSPLTGNDSGWIAYYVTELAALNPPPENYVVGAARAAAGTPTVWADRGPIVSTNQAYQDPGPPRSYRDESPHLFKLGGQWLMFFTSGQYDPTNGSIRYLTGSNPLGDAFADNGSWTYRGPSTQLHPYTFASESFAEPYPFSTASDQFFATIMDAEDPSQRHIEVYEITSAATGSDPFHIREPLHVTAMTTGFNDVVEGDSFLLTMWPGQELKVPPDYYDVHLEVYEVDDNTGTETRIDPTTVGIPDPLPIPLFFSNPRSYFFTSKFFIDDDDTPQQLEIEIRFRGLTTNRVTIHERVTPTTLIDPVSSYRPKDFAIVKVDSLFHCLYIRNNSAAECHGESNQFGHATSPDLRTWTFFPDNTLFRSDPNAAAWDHDHVWAPSIVENAGTFWMFYTGAKDENGCANPTQKIGVASTMSRDLTGWQRSLANPILEPSDVPWAVHPTADFRDPFVTPSIGLPGDPGWLMYYVTHPQGPDPVNGVPVNQAADYVVGIAHAGGNTMDNWTDLTPLWMPHAYTHLVESPHILKHALNYMFFTQDGGGVRYEISVQPTTQNWIDQGTVLNGFNDAFASEAFTVTYADGSKEDFFAHATSAGSAPLLFYQFAWYPSGFYFIEPLRVDHVLASPSAPSQVAEGQPVTLTFQTSTDDGRPRKADLDVFEIDGTTRHALDPTQVGLPRTITLTQQNQDLVFNILSNYADNDGTPERAEVVVRCKGVESPVIYVTRDITPPAAVTNLAKSLYKTTALVSWTAPGDDGNTGTAYQYDLRMATFPITGSNFGDADAIGTQAPQVAGSFEQVCLAGLNPGTWYWFALKTADEKGNWSGLSNVPSGRTRTTGGDVFCDGYRAASLEPTDASLPMRLALGVPSPNPGREKVQVAYDLPRSVEGERLEIVVFDVMGRRVQSLVENAAQPGRFAATWNLTRGDGGRVSPGLYFVRMRVGDWQQSRTALVMR